MIITYIKTTHSLSLIQSEQEVQGQQAFAFSVVTVNDEHTKPGSKESVGVKFREGICPGFCLSSDLKATVIFVI